MHLDIPQEEHLHTYSLPNGVQLWTKYCNIPPHTLSLRVVWTVQGRQNAYRADVSAFDFDEVHAFFEACLEMIEEVPEEAAVIAVGDVPEEEIRSIMTDYFYKLPHVLGQQNIHAIAIEVDYSSSETEIALNYPMPAQSVHSWEDLKKQRIVFFLQKLIHNRLQQSLAETDRKAVIQSGSRFLLPNPICSIKAACNAEDSLEVLGGYLVAIQTLRQEAFSEEELSPLKGVVQKALLSAYRYQPDSSTLADYFIDQLALGVGCPAYAFYMQHSLDMLGEITPRDINLLMPSLINDENRQVIVRGPEGLNLTQEQIQETLDSFQANMFFPKEEAITAVQPIKPGIDPYLQLLISEEEADVIYKIIDILANNNPISLGFKKKDLEKKGKKIGRVHPMRFLGTIFSNPYLKKCMVEINDSIFKRHGFVNGLADRMDEEYERNNLYQYIGGFSQSVKGNPEVIKMYLQKKDWYGLISYLIKI